jgi:hypothetical protein
VGDALGLQDFDQALAGGGVTLARFGDQGGAVSSGAFHAQAVPFFGGFERPLGGLILVAAIAGVGCAEVAGELGVRDGPAVVMPPVALHVRGLRHVAIDALAAGAVGAVEGVGGGDDGWGIGEAACGVAAHAELVAGQDRFAAVHVMAIHAAHAGVLHAAAEEAGKLKVFIAHLAVWEVGVGVIGDGQQVVIPKGIAGFEVASDLPTAGVAAGAVLGVLIAIPFHQVWILAFFVGVLFLPLAVVLHRPVAGFATDRHLRHGGAVAIRCRIVVFPHSGVVAGGAHLIPNHAAPSPVPPLAGLAIFIAIDIEPLAQFGVEAGFHGLKPSIAAIDQHLPQGIMADDAFHFIRALFVVKAEGNHFKGVAGFAGFGGLRAVGKALRGYEAGAVQFVVGQTFRHAVV